MSHAALTSGTRGGAEPLSFRLRSDVARCPAGLLQQSEDEDAAGCGRQRSCEARASAVPRGEHAAGWARVSRRSAAPHGRAASGSMPPADPEWRRGALPPPVGPMRFGRPLCVTLDGFTLHAATRAGRAGTGSASQVLVLRRGNLRDHAAEVHPGEPNASLGKLRAGPGMRQTARESSPVSGCSPLGRPPKRWLIRRRSAGIANARKAVGSGARTSVRSYVSAPR